MKLSIFEADLKRDKKIIIEILNHNIDYSIDDSRYEWLYLRNPSGKAKVWIGKDEDKDQFIGTAVALPRKFWVNGRTISCHVLADFSINPEYRSLGPALKLNRASLDPVHDGRIPFAYDFPSKSMAVAHRWMKVEPIGQVLRFVRLLRAGRQIEERVGKGLISRILAWIVNTAMRIYSVQKMSKGYTFDDEKIDPKSFDVSFTELDRHIGKRYKVCGSRDQSYLTWRYALNTHRDFFLIKLKYHDELCGFIIFTIRENSRVQVYDLYSKDQAEVKRNLIKALLKVVYNKNAEAVEVALLETNPWIPLIRRCGFFPRSDTSEVYVFIPKDSDLDGVVNNAGNWYMTQGDRDI